MKFKYTRTLGEVNPFRLDYLFMVKSVR